MPENKGKDVAETIAQLNCFLDNFNRVADETGVGKTWNAVITIMENSRSTIEYLMEVLNYISNANGLIGDMNHSQRDFIMSLSDFNSEWDEGETEE